MLTYELKKREGVPLYEELFEEIRRDITAGNLRDGERLPSKRSLAKHLNISVNTVEHAYLKLVEEEYVRSEKGRGFFVDSGTEWPDSPMKMGFHGWNVAAVRKREVRANDEDGAEDSETFSMDFKGNKCSVSLFPSSTWVKLMRSLLSGEDKELFEPIPYNGHLSLRRAIAEHLRRYKGMEVDPEAIIIGAGTEFLYRRLLEMMGPGTMVAFEDPGYKQLTQMCVNAGGLYS
ncbi:MAG: aminotransferase class I/II-fold pyridoxal phosphate-dependent enzyme, partial [Eubacterium sp.]|nr:aminotransferase class I/II-fold pyridoxal phosphate-dependent enzyme [Eubacterium sp.]